jgi:hypothetical protein
MKYGFAMEKQDDYLSFKKICLRSSEDCSGAAINQILFIVMAQLKE